MFSACSVKMSGKRVQVTGSSMYPLAVVVDSSVRRNNTDIGALAAKDGAGATVMIWNYHDDDRQVESVAAIDLTITAVPASRVSIIEYRIDQEHSNSYDGMEENGISAAAYSRTN